MITTTHPQIAPMLSMLMEMHDFEYTGELRSYGGELQQKLECQCCGMVLWEPIPEVNPLSDAEEMQEHLKAQAERRKNAGYGLGDDFPFDISQLFGSDEDEDEEPQLLDEEELKARFDEAKADLEAKADEALKKISEKSPFVGALLGGLKDALKERAEQGGGTSVHEKGAYDWENDPNWVPWAGALKDSNGKTLGKGDKIIIPDQKSLRSNPATVTAIQKMASRNDHFRVIFEADGGEVEGIPDSKVVGGGIDYREDVGWASKVYVV